MRVILRSFVRGRNESYIFSGKKFPRKTFVIETRYVFAETERKIVNAMILNRKIANVGKS